VPKKFNVQRSLPILPVGKIDKQALKKVAAKKAAAASLGNNDNKNSG
jgi:non-ribosomal peptide synthetase component E (peptide arylation enzyme)